MKVCIDKKDWEMIFSKCHLFLSDIRLMSEEETRKYKTNEPISDSETTRKRTPATSTSQYFEEAISDSRDGPETHSIANGISQYLSNKAKSRDTNVLDVWKQIVQLAMAFLEIPATSCLSEGQFNKTQDLESSAY